MRKECRCSLWGKNAPQSVALDAGEAASKMMLATVGGWTREDKK